MVEQSPLWHRKRVVQEVREGPVFECLSDDRRGELAAIPVRELANAVTAALTRPQPRDMPHAGVVANVVYAAQYYELFEALKLPREVVVIEPAVGGSDPVVLATEAYSEGGGSYCAVNLNGPLTDELRAKVAHLKMSIRIIEDNAQHALSHLDGASFDVACFHHAINDILQTAVSEPRGMDTSTVDWWPNERQMIQWLAEDFATGRIERRGRPELMKIIESAVELVHPGGYLIFDHWVWLGYRDQEWFPWRLFCDLAPITRQWIEESSLPISELTLPGANPQWWMFFRKDAAEH